MQMRAWESDSYTYFSPLSGITKDRHAIFMSLCFDMAAQQNILHTQRSRHQSHASLNIKNTASSIIWICALFASAVPFFALSTRSFERGQSMHEGRGGFQTDAILQMRTL